MSSTLNRQNRLAFWCQKVLPLVYDDSLSYYELLCKVVKHLNDNTDAINVLIEFFNSYAAEIKEVIEEMLEDGELDPIIANVLGALIASPYDESETYIQFDYCIYNSKLYRANSSTTGEFDPEKWDEKVLADDISILEHRIYGLTANHVAYDNAETYDNDTVGKKLSELSLAISTLDDLNVKSSLTSSDDLNNLYGSSATGVYFLTSGVVNSPIDWQILLCIGRSTNESYQLIIGDRLYARERVGNPPAWTPWRIVNRYDSLIPANTNFNSIVTIGDYYVDTNANSETMTNIPVQYMGRLIVMSGTGSDQYHTTGSYLRQIYIPYNSNAVYMRTSSNGGNTWSSWETNTTREYGSLYSETDGYVFYQYSPALHICTIGFVGTSTAPTAGVTSISLPAKLKPYGSSNVSAALRYANESIEVRLDGKVNLMLSGSAWSGGSVTYLTV